MNPSRLSFCILLICCLGAAPLPPSNLRTNDAASPVGTGATPYFGWFVNDPDQGEVQSKYQVLVASSEANLNANTGDLWDSGEVAGRLQNHVAYAGKPLSGDGQYFWKVRTWDKDGAAGAFSAAAKFVVGPAKNEDWSGAQWIWRNNNAPDDYTYYRKKLSLAGKAITRATVYISSAHKYALYVNGTLVGKGPAYQYPQYQYYNGYDITSLINGNGENLFAVFNHWFGGGQGRAVNARGVLMKAVIHFTDGSNTVVGTDGTWKHLAAPQWIPGQGQHNAGEGVGFIEKIDASRVIVNWNKLDLDDSSWTSATAVGAPPVQPWVNVLQPDLTRIEETEMTPPSVTDKGGGKVVIDFGKVYAAVPKITFTGGDAGTVINMAGGYGLTAEGVIDTRRNQSTNMAYFVVLDGKEFVYQPECYLGMRYFQIDNLPANVKITAKFVARHNAMSTTNSSFVSSDKTLNAVWDLMKHSLFTCAQEEFVDTPTREKGGFLGDGAIQSTVAMPVVGERLLTNRVIREFIHSMEQFWSTEENRGRMNAVYPNNDGGRDIPDFTQAYLAWVWEYYMQTGDRQFLVDNFQHFKEIADYANRYKDAESGLITNLRGGSGQYNFGIIDWPAPMRFGYDMSAAARSVINHWAYLDADLVSRIAGELGNNADRDAYRQRADALKAAINGKLINSAGLYVDGLSAAKAQSAHVSQHANMFPLALHIVPDANREAVKAKVKELKMSVGMVTVMWLVKALGEADEGAHMIDLFTNPEWYGWAQTLARGGTATWETWTSDTDGQSESHAWGSAGLVGHVNYILGITPTKPQFEQVRIKPLDFGARLTSAKGTIPTDRGDISVDWNRTAERYTLTVSLPVNVTGDIYVPRGSEAGATLTVDGAAATGVVDGGYLVVRAIGSGTHTIVRAASR